MGDAMNIICERGTKQEYADADSGARFFSVTQIRQMAYDSYAQVPAQYLEAARHRGNLVHTFLWKYLAHRSGLFPAVEIDQRIPGYCQSIIDWAEKQNVEAVLLEHKSANVEEGYAGQADFLVQYGKKRILTLGDGKSGEPTVTDAMQLVLYNLMRDFKEAKQLVDVYFQEDGSAAKEVFITAAQKITELAWGRCALGVLRGRVGHNCL